MKIKALIKAIFATFGIIGLMFILYIIDKMIGIEGLSSFLFFVGLSIFLFYTSFAEREVDKYESKKED